jgi:hypothetical protein
LRGVCHVSEPSITIIISQFEKLNEKEKDLIATGLSRHLGKPLQFTLNTAIVLIALLLNKFKRNNHLMLKMVIRTIDTR